MEPHGSVVCKAPLPLRLLESTCHHTGNSQPVLPREKALAQGLGMLQQAGGGSPVAACSTAAAGYG